jgi:hypothetical protein
VTPQEDAAELAALEEGGAAMRAAVEFRASKKATVATAAANLNDRLHAIARRVEAEDSVA